MPYLLKLLLKQLRIEFCCLPIMWLLKLICCLRTTEDDDDAVKEEIVDAAGDDNTVVVVGELISPSFFSQA